MPKLIKLFVMDVLVESRINPDYRKASLLKHSFKYFFIVKQISFPAMIVLSFCFPPSLFQYPHPFLTSICPYSFPPLSPQLEIFEF